MKTQKFHLHVGLNLELCLHLEASSETEAQTIAMGIIKKACHEAKLAQFEQLDGEITIIIPEDVAVKDVTLGVSNHIGDEDKPAADPKGPHVIH